MNSSYCLNLIRSKEEVVQTDLWDFLFFWLWALHLAFPGILRDVQTLSRRFSSAAVLVRFVASSASDAVLTPFCMRQVECLMQFPFALGWCAWSSKKFGRRALIYDRRLGRSASTPNAQANSRSIFTSRVVSTLPHTLSRDYGLPLSSPVECCGASPLEGLMALRPPGCSPVVVQYGLVAGSIYHPCGPDWT